MRTINGTEVRVVGVLGSLQAGGVEHVMCEAHPGSKGRGFCVPVAVADIEGGLDAVKAALAAPAGVATYALTDAEIDNMPDGPSGIVDDREGEGSHAAVKKNKQKRTQKAADDFGDL